MWRHAVKTNQDTKTPERTSEAAPKPAELTSEISTMVTIEAQTLLQMQERLVWLEANLSDANHVIDELFQRVDKLERQIRYLASMTEAPSAVRPLSEEVPPPHY